MNKRLGLLLLSSAAALATLNASAEPSGAQVFYRYGWNFLGNSRGSQIFTDVNGASGTKNDDTGGWNIGAGLDLPLFKAFGPGDVLGEIMVDYAHFSQKEVSQAAGVLTGNAAATSKVSVTELQVMIAPKYRLGFLENKLRAWIIPAGIAFLVNSPPSNDTNYLDLGYPLGIGVEYAFVEELSIGTDFRYTIAFNEPNTKVSYGQFDLYVGLNF